MTSQNAQRLATQDVVAMISSGEHYEVHVVMRDSFGETIIMARPMAYPTNPDLMKRLRPSDVRFVCRPDPLDDLIYVRVYDESSKSEAHP